jgi:hypothetical protein
VSLSQTLTTSFKQQLLQGVHNFDTNTFKVALYTAVADLNDTTTAYNVATAGQVSGTGYTAGGDATTTSVSVTGTVAFVNFSNVVWTAAITARGALIYNDTVVGKPSVAILDFGADKTSTTTFTVAMPTNSSTSALIRLP